MNLEISDRDRVVLLIDDFDLDAQLLAIKSLLHRNRKAEQVVAADIKKLDTFIRGYKGGDDQEEMHLANEWVDRMHGTVFQDAAHSMSAVGMLAPFIESLFVAIFRAPCLRRHFDRKPSTNDARTAASQDEFWDPHFFFVQGGRRKDLTAGIAQLAASTGLTAFLPEGYEKMLSALFSYRNKMLHHGFEWPVEERTKFAKRLDDKEWPVDWFTKAESDHKPWIFYLSDTFIETCLKMIDQVLAGVGRYVVENKIQIFG